ncbi:MAG: SemiSWEET family transporter, partial [Bacteroidota bacterium]
MQFNIELIGIIAGIFSTAGFVPQVYKTWRTKSVEDLSMGMIVILVIGILLWLIYGFYKNAPSV